MASACSFGRPVAHGSVWIGSSASGGGETTGIGAALTVGKPMGGSIRVSEIRLTLSRLKGKRNPISTGGIRVAKINRSGRLVPMDSSSVPTASKSSVQSRISPCCQELPEDLQYVLPAPFDIVNQIILNAVKIWPAAFARTRSLSGNVTWGISPSGWRETV